MQKFALIPASGWLVIGLAGCSAEPLTPGLTEPLRVHNAQFFEGPLPGKLPLTAEELNAGVEAEFPTLTSFEFTGRSVSLGEPSKAVRGRASTDTSAVAIAFADAGSGYWLLPVGGADPAFGGEYSWSATLDVGYAIRPGRHELSFAAIDSAGRSGTRRSSSLCVTSPIPDHQNACDPKLEPPHTVISLEWDAAVDLDLQVRTPEGKLVDPKHPTSAIEQADGTLDLAARNLGRLDKDAGRACLAGGVRRENLVFEAAPPPGLYSVSANLYEACGLPSVRFNLTLFGVIPGDEPGTFRQVETYRVSGIGLAAQANGGSKIGQFLTEIVVQ